MSAMETKIASMVKRIGRINNALHKAFQWFFSSGEDEENCLDYTGQFDHEIGFKLLGTDEQLKDLDLQAE